MRQSQYQPYPKFGENGYSALGYGTDTESTRLLVDFHSDCRIFEEFETHDHPGMPAAAVIHSFLVGAASVVVADFLPGFRLGMHAEHKAFFSKCLREMNKALLCELRDR